VRFFSQGTESTGELESVSRAGLFVRSTDLPRPGVVIAVQFESPAGPLVDVRGEVRWSTQGVANANAPEGFGVILHEPPRVFRDFYAWVQAQDEKEDRTPDV